MDLAALRSQLDALEAKFQEWARPINQVIRECCSKVNRGDYTQKDFARDVERARQAQLARYNPYQEIYELLDQLCPAYLEATPETRAAARALVSDKEGLLSALLGYAYRAAERLRARAKGEWLLWGLAAISVENCRRDYRDVLLALKELYVAAKEAGRNPRPAFKAVSRLSSEERPTGGPIPVSTMLADFHTYAVLEERRRR